MNLGSPRIFLPDQAKILLNAEDYRFLLYSGAFQAGKSLIGCHLAITQCLEYPGNEWLIGRQSYTELEDTTQATFFEELALYQELVDEADIPLTLLRQFNKTKRRAIFCNGSSVIFRSFEKISKAFIKFKGYRLGGVFIDEAVDLTENTFKMLRGRINRPGFPHMIFFATNPAEKESWLYQEFLDAFKGIKSKSHLVVQCNTLDNPHLDEDYRLDMLSLKDKDPEFFKRYVMGRWGRFSGLVYPQFDEDIHMIKYFDIPDGWRRMRVIDPGYTNPFCCLWIAIDNDDNYYVYDELYREKEIVPNHAKRILEKSGEDEFDLTFIDPSAAAVAAELDSMGIPCTEANNDVFLGLQKVTEKLAANKLFIFEGCPRTKSEFQSYKWRESTGLRSPDEKPLKLNDHAMDCIRYGLLSWEGIPDDGIFTD